MKFLVILAMIFAFTVGANAQLSHYAQINLLGSVAERREYVSKLSPTAKAEVWHEHLRVASQFVTPEQREFISRVSDAITSETFGSKTGRLDILRFETEALTAFADKDQRVAIFAFIGSPITPELARMAKPVISKCGAVVTDKAPSTNLLSRNCNCSVGSSWNSCSACTTPIPWCYSNPDDGCGFLYLFTCDGRCS